MSSLAATSLITSSRTVYCEDAITWLQKHVRMPTASIVVSLPDISEFKNFDLSQWKDWFVETAKLILSRTADNQVTIFYQSDIKINDAWVDKAFLCQKAAESLEHSLLWHKIACRIPAGTPSQGRSGYSHLLCFSKSLKLKSRDILPDVFPQIGKQTWARGMGMDTCLAVAQFLAQKTTSQTLINPFCGQGGLLAAANAWGLSAIGIEKNSSRAELARRQKIHGGHWSTTP